MQVLRAAFMRLQTPPTDTEGFASWTVMSFLNIVIAAKGQSELLVFIALVH